MADRDNNPDDTLDDLFSGYSKGLNESRVPELEASELKAFELGDMWKNIESQLQDDAENFVGHQNMPQAQWEPSFLSAYADGELPLNDPEVVLFEKQLAHNPIALQEISTIQGLSDLLHQYGHRAEAACTLDLTDTVMTEFQSTNSIEQDKTSPIIALKQKKKPWLAIPLTAAAAVMFILLTGSPFSLDFLESDDLKASVSSSPQTLAFVQKNQDSAFDLAGEVSSHEESLQREELFQEEKEWSTSANMDSVESLNPKKIVQKTKNSTENQKPTFARFSNIFDEADGRGQSLGSTTSVSRFETKQKKRKQESRGRGITLASAESLVLGEVPLAQDSVQDRLKTNFSDAESRRDQGLGSRAGHQPKRAQENFLAKSIAARKVVASPGLSSSIIPTAEDYVMMYCNKPLPEPQADSTSFFMQTCITTRI